MFSEKCIQEASKSKSMWDHSCPKPTPETGPACEDRFRVVTWRYVGGALGRCGYHHLCEAAIREELYKGGPLVTSIEPTSGFGYAGGVLHGVPGIKESALLGETHTPDDHADCNDTE